ncbi:MAG: M20/M25/M40 family metallo-hydrolase [Eubacteriales bacterium]|nr:M20/M25/M40 family metallo-hydrolase [Eubacteriales bacterium]
MKLTDRMEKYAASTREEVKQFIRDLAPIPAPSNHEEKRVEWVKNWMEKQGAKGVYVDDALNVIWPVNDTGENDLVVFMAHTDVVFPDTETLPFREEGDTMWCPGIGDDTARLATLLYAYKYYFDNDLMPKNGTGVLIVANSCEEGLGNLKGSRKIIDTFGKRVKALITVDGNLSKIVTRAVGSHRYKVTVRTEGGHSYNAFGNRNAIAYLASMIGTLYDIKVPTKEDTKTTYNVGAIEGGTSVNTIAEEATMLYEYRSDDRECLAIMKNCFEKVIEAYRAMGIEVEVELLGERPCSGDVPEEEFKKLKAIMDKAAFDTLGIKKLIEESGSTDANYPLSKGIPSVCIGGSISKGAHRREESLNVPSLYDGVRFLMNVMSYYFEVC